MRGRANAWGCAQALMSMNKRTPLDQFVRQTLSEATRADAADSLDALWTQLALQREQQSGMPCRLPSSSRLVMFLCGRTPYPKVCYFLFTAVV